MPGSHQPLKVWDCGKHGLLLGCGKGLGQYQTPGACGAWAVLSPKGKPRQGFEACSAFGNSDGHLFLTHTSETLLLWVLGVSEMCPLWSQGRDLHGVCLWCPLWPHACFPCAEDVEGAWIQNHLSVSSCFHTGSSRTFLPSWSCPGPALVFPHKHLCGLVWDHWLHSPASMLCQARSYVSECSGGRVSLSPWMKEPRFSHKRENRKLGISRFILKFF